ncbi:MAG TPA: NADH:ubiquinone oxidoreductase subunit NDUFA12 [Thermopetrobacter sp.]|nr:NADH:ubiquinone oxidoreductase subunit NDUFA12 [Thermopetrobacter sp.]
MGFRDFLAQVFTWWNGATVGTRFYTWRKGVRVGEDDQGNVYYRTVDGSRRWVIYNGYAEASRIPPGWYGWIHFRTDVPPGESAYRPHPWEKPHMANPTGTPEAVHPPGSLYHRRPREMGRPSWRAWRPGGE